MNPTTLETICAVSTVIVVVVAIITDLRSRRIPNVLTFTAFGVALAVRVVFQGWTGLGIALAGAVIAPGVLWVTHLGRGIGMGDLKLAIAIGAFLGPRLAAVSMLAATIIGGILAIAFLMRRGQLLSDFFSLCLLGLPFVKARKSAEPPATEPDGASAVLTMPYGVAIGMGSLATLAVVTWL